MSLEAALAENTATMKQLIAVLQSTCLPTTGASAAEMSSAATDTKATRGRKPKDGAAGNAATEQGGSPGSPTAAPSAQGAAGAGASLTNDSGAVRYIHIEANRTVAAIQPGEVMPSIAGMVEINAEQYASLKAQYAAPVPSSGAAATGAAAAAPASSTPAASTASAPASSGAQTSTGADGQGVLAGCQKLHGHLGNNGLGALLKKYIVAENGFDAAAVASPKVPALIAKAADLGAKVAADIDALLKLPKDATADAIAATLAPQPAAAADNSGFFG